MPIESCISVGTAKYYAIDRIYRIVVWSLLTFISQKLFAQPEHLIETFMTNYSVPGMFVGLVRDDSILFQKSFGTADLKTGTKVSPSTCFELGSISKGFAAEIIYALQHQGLINVQDPIHKYLPQVPASWTGITIKHLLMHTSGLQNYLLDPRFKADVYFTNENDLNAEQFFNAITPDSMLRLFYGLPIEFKPGATWSYNNTGYYLLGMISEVVTGKPFFQLVQEMLTMPLQMHRTMANEEARNQRCLAQGYWLKDSTLMDARLLHSHYAYAAGAWATTGQDMLNYLRAIHNRRILSDHTGWKWRIAPQNNDLPYAYDGGRFYTTFHGLNVVSHNGGTPGFSSSWIYVVEKNLSVIVLMNRQDFAAIDQLAWDLLAAVEPSLSYPRQEHSGAGARKMVHTLHAFIHAIKNDLPHSSSFSMPLQKFLNSASGRGYWKWYFERGYPETVKCVEIERIGQMKLYRFILSTSAQVNYQLSALFNKNGQIIQLRWW